MKKPFTEQEEQVMNSILKAHDIFVKMKQMNPDDIREWVDGIHKCQNVLMSRVVTRDYPDVFLQ
jgi:DNA-directed RNA polymerase subunit F